MMEAFRLDKAAEYRQQAVKIPQHCRSGFTP